MVLLKGKYRAIAVGLGFGWSVAPSVSQDLPIATNTAHLQSIVQPVAKTGLQETNLLVAIGMSEGTRTKDGGKNPAWTQHYDPGNGELNKGSCSWQATPVTTPEEADVLCLQHLEQKLKEVPPGSSEFVALAYLDAWIQAPAAAADFFKILKDAPGEREFDRVLYARVRSFIDPTSGRWNAPGLGNTVEGITDDQDRRLDELVKYLEP